MKKAGFIKQLSGIFLAAVITLSAVPAQSAKAVERKLVPLGNSVGISIQSEGVMVVGIANIQADGKTISPSGDAGIIVGDIITRIDDENISTRAELEKAIEKMDGAPISVHLLRGGRKLQVTLTPHKSAEGIFELGLHLRDGMSGVGTLTFYDPETGVFGALGHSINDLETGSVFPLKGGYIMRASITEVIPGQSGMPGQLIGSFNPHDKLGNLSKNSFCGIFGTMEQNDIARAHEALPIASGKELKTGDAVILSNVYGNTVEEYAIEITRIYEGAESQGRNMMIKVTDPRLLKRTGGIVQGMSGSPIIQNGKLVGAITHVLVNEPNKGYGISIEKMLIAAENMESHAA